MEDSTIIELYFDRNEDAIVQTKNKYGRMLSSISMRILHSLEDADECENDTYLKTWNVIPPQRPDIFSAFLSRIVRNLSLDRYDMMHADKRGNAQVGVLLDELAEVIADDKAGDSDSARELSEILNRFLSEQKELTRKMFIRRYYFGYSVAEIAEKYDLTESNVKMTLLRVRNKLKDYLEKEGVTV
ncbi:RNA polymerase sigma-70 factor, ECF subfamily [Butyrivibrio fibrisolvens DSM 3071]|uniref:RNA polymerase sigma-70 factor, ECF subfamily n=2 Tax=Butyrivibrio fibrisolvens TaxID=831 RepID=A0A1M6BW68_BUTFI|nr:RNA polymerase sigma-70 factor, ECF subfamily [Butyrivibrio fibrisolvens DSM 3071]